MTNKEKKMRRLLKLYNDPKNWTPPTMQSLADKLGIGKTLVFYYLRKLKKDGLI